MTNEYPTGSWLVVTNDRRAYHQSSWSRRSVCPFVLPASHKAHKRYGESVMEIFVAFAPVSLFAAGGLLACLSTLRFVQSPYASPHASVYLMASVGLLLQDAAPSSSGLANLVSAHSHSGALGFDLNAVVQMMQGAITFRVTMSRLVMHS
ncbi:hypothetical protein BDN71DRAFT_578533 [Pleurotus eryngii]|uniref:Uncharacterized protein n=1 Tax=Pleurotus eryngii TaxID=5323 RepID=A0A9P6D8N0_PLEER|nr:hypothetical protein BDN71DRAFT_578533 [Pleurotus eryngii]